MGKEKDLMKIKRENIVLEVEDKWKKMEKKKGGNKRDELEKKKIENEMKIRIGGDIDRIIGKKEIGWNEEEIDRIGIEKKKEIRIREEDRKEMVRKWRKKIWNLVNCRRIDIIGEGKGKKGLSIDGGDGLDIGRMEIKNEGNGRKRKMSLKI